MWRAAAEFAILGDVVCDTLALTRQSPFSSFRRLEFHGYHIIMGRRANSPNHKLFIENNKIFNIRKIK